MDNPLIALAMKVINLEANDDCGSKADELHQARIDLADQADVILLQCNHVAAQHISLGACADNINKLTSERDDLLVALCEEVSSRLRGFSYDTWSITADLSERIRMRKSLVSIAKARGKSAFGNDWQDALL